MRRKFCSAAVLGAMTVFAALPTGASAAHCVDAGNTAPGFSYFGTDHVQEATHAEGRTPGHMGTPGASNCRERTGSPSERAPGQN